ncbi:MmgE/PrpD family protein [Ornithinimicrobium murale]|uniref:MmgE/PrpD family protein n=1 Tax=Ornithinimicrobium murale TaxID=1050153 RepID=UPI0013B43102|nr:MmgE/PrpD family protein [Ornithinimicrobium murale]
MTNDQQLLENATAFVADETYNDSEVRARARVLLADAVTLALAADTVPGATELLELGVGAGEHAAWYSGNGLGAADAVQSNAAAICARFQDDTEMSSWSHPGSFVVPAAVGAAVETDRAYGELVDGLIAGYAMTVWLGGGGEVALGMMKSGRRPSPTFGPAGACAAACRAAGLNRQETLHAVSGALLVGRGSLHSVGSGGEDWRLHNPGAARDGLLYALAARAGMTAGSGALDSRHGFLSLSAGMTEVPVAMERPPHAGMVLDVWHKALPTLGDNMAVALAALELNRRGLGGIDLGKVDEVVVSMNEHFRNFPGTQTRPPYKTLTSALSSVRFVTAQLLVHGTLDFDDYERRDDPAVVSLAERVEVVPDEALDYLDGVVTVRAHGQEHTCRSADLPRTLFFRDANEQRRISESLHGPAGAALVDALVQADDSVPARKVVHEAIHAFHSTRNRT